VSGQYVAYGFFRVDPAWRRVPVEERAAGKDAFAEVVEDWAGRMDRCAPARHRRPAGRDFFLRSRSATRISGELGAELNGTPLAGWLETPYSYPRR
jgi:chlorite dismutase